MNIHSLIQIMKYKYNAHVKSLQNSETVGANSVDPAQAAPLGSA